MASEPTDEMVEAAAEAAYEEHWRLRNSRDSRCPWAKLGPAKAPWLLEARAALTAALAVQSRTQREKDEDTRRWQLCERPDLYNQGKCCGKPDACAMLATENSHER